MDRNFFLAFALSLLVLVLWSSWQAGRQGDVPPGETQEAITQREAPAPRTLDEGRAAEVGEPPPAPPVDAQPLAEAQVVTVETDLYRVDLTSRGGSLLHLELSQYRDAAQPGAPPVELTTLVRGESALHTPFAGLGRGDLSAVAYEVERPSR